MSSTPETMAARKAINRHVYHHHAKTTVSGNLDERLQAHDDLHWQAKQEGTYVGHEHEPLGDDETAHDLAHRYLAEGGGSPDTSPPISSE